MLKIYRIAGLDGNCSFIDFLVHFRSLFPSMLPINPRKKAMLGKIRKSNFEKMKATVSRSQLLLQIIPLPALERCFWLGEEGIWQLQGRQLCEHMHTFLRCHVKYLQMPIKPF